MATHSDMDGWDIIVQVGSAEGQLRLTTAPDTEPLDSKS